MQDSEEDWLHESQKMGDIFNQARFVIAAHASVDDQDGFLGKALGHGPTIDYEYADEEWNHGLMNRKGFAMYLRANVETDIANSAFSRRGWVLQERLLASRTIHFTTAKIYTETADGVEAETPFDTLIATGQHSGLFASPSAAPRLRRLLGLRRTSKLRAGHESLADIAADESYDTSTLSWLDLIEIYSNCELTNEGDKLVAISGMVQKVYNNTRNLYCAGLWSDTIAQGLLWLRVEVSLRRPKRPRAPSWSWASYDGPIQYADEIKAPISRRNAQSSVSIAQKNQRKMSSFCKD